ncbi:acetate--CoA ligase [Spelaeicoccus albus]|uniref:Acetyl-coenzyme A synthetase n=1 Tax=Spelaeicoccus albus TaxID=1280376 RepID=A0A7Z0ACA7_9MICO|nr:acetate--CoA ligase [Spelaeicoccus albus]NYI66561.1 acetyl-CoA synthetase [Spelaeicoccus albus]
MTTPDPELSALLHESRQFDPPAELAAHANAQPDVYQRAKEDRLGFWADQARRLTWDREWDDVLQWELPYAKWFVGGTLNAAVNCVDRHVDAGNGDRVAFHWVGEPEDDTRAITYRQLKDDVCRAANALTDLGVRAGDRVAIYMPMIPETVVAMLACARLGAPHTVVFAGYSADALKTRIIDCDAHVVITADGSWRKGSINPLKPAVDEAVSECPDVRSVLVVRRTEQDVDWTDGRDVWWHDVVDSASPEHVAEMFDAEHPLYVMYTSGTTGKPKGVLHTTGGYLTHVSATCRLIFDMKPETDVFWTAADIGWVTGHSYIVYGPLANGVTSVMYEGAPDAGGKDRWWKIIEDYKVTILYTAPTTIRTFMKWGEEYPRAHDLSSLRILGSVGEPINPEAWIWYRKNIGGNKTAVVDTWWQTENGGVLITPLPGITRTKPGAAMQPFPGISADVVNNEGRAVANGEAGFVVITEPWPGMLRGIWGDDERYKKTYWSKFEGVYFAGDGAKKDEDGDFWLLGRVDDVMNVSGHRISTTEVESALVSHPSVAEAAVVGASDAVTGQGIVAFVSIKAGVDEEGDAGAALVDDLRATVARQIGKIARPRQILLTPELPKTRSGKIMRRLLLDVAEHRELGDVTTLADSSVVSAIADQMEASTAAGDE